MSDLVPSFGPCTVEEARTRLLPIIGYLRRCTGTALDEINQVIKKGDEKWALRMKRVPVTLADCERPDGIGPSAGSQHNFAEVFTQAATLSRLYDAFLWIISSDSGLRKFSVRICHPTTSSTSGNGSVKNNDLELVSQDGMEVARFEVSDIVRGKNNYKIQNDLLSLKAIAYEKGAFVAGDHLGKERLYLVGSNKLKGYVENTSSMPSVKAVCDLSPFAVGTGILDLQTWIIEVKKKETKQ